jgi:undecaprenyl-diphosphatase
MSSGNTDEPIPSTPAEAAQAVQQQSRFSAAFLRRHGWRLLLVFAGLLLPLWMLGALVETLREGEAFTFDIPLL